MVGPTGAVVLVTVVRTVQEAVTPLAVLNAGFAVRTAGSVHTDEETAGG